MSEKKDVFLPMGFGTYDEARDWIGRKSEIRDCDSEVNWPAIKYFCALVRDANPNYWDAGEARRRFGAVISPPGMVMVWPMPVPWRPEGRSEHFVMATEVPLPGDTLINVSTDSEFFKPMKVGDRLSVQEEVVDVTPEKKTALGPGHFVTTLATLRNQNGEVVATNRNVLFRYSSGQDPDAQSGRPS